VLERDTKGAEIFGMPGTTKRAEVVAGAVELSQIASLIDLQPRGIEGKLLKDGQFNIFAVIGKNGEVLDVNVIWYDDREWRVECARMGEQSIWCSGSQVFNN
jgi:hypothetical protein